MPIFDTLAFAKRLRTAGLCIEVADELTIALHDLLRDLVSEDPGVAINTDLATPTLSRLQLMRATRAHEDIYDRSIDVQILRLRRKLAADPSGTGLIKTDRGLGYTLDAHVENLH